MPRVKAVVGEHTPFRLEWCSVYAFRCARLERFVHGRIVFIGDSAHVVSPFGARGGNGGIQDVDNLCWKLARVVQGRAPDSLIATYDEERGHGADENILNSSRTTNFMSPKGGAERLFRDAVLDLAPHAGFARALVNAGRLSRPCSLAGLSLQSHDTEGWAGGPVPGSVGLDAPVTGPDGRPGWLLNHVGGDFTLLGFVENDEGLASLTRAGSQSGLRVVAISGGPLAANGTPVLIDSDGLAKTRYAAGGGGAYLIRPDQHVAARFRDLDPAAVAIALWRSSRSQAVREAA
jgi:3-(3-hydroxy-phenyl)propionate hydroxylase